MKASLLLSLLIASLLTSTSALAVERTCKYPTEAIDVPGEVTKGTIALTFDDGPNPATTPHVLDVLKKYNIKATFFLVGQNIVGQEEIVRRTLADGHNIGVHTWSHPHIPQISVREMHKEILKTIQILKQFPKDRAQVMRFPFGESTCKAEAYVESLHYNIVGWDMDSCDWSYQEGLEKSDCVPKEFQAKYAGNYQGWIDHQLKEIGGGIILMHDAEPYEADHLEAEILHMKKLGLKFVELDRGAFPELIHDHKGQSKAPPAQASK
jgi:peptidoglycan/xylan/chitin deacetylase (PgdA/CDA1 family)